jgi:hypothetical protein
MTAAESVAFLRSRRVRLDPGLTGTELAAIEERFGFAFSPDHRAFLSLALPRGERWIDWRGDDSVLEEALWWPERGVLFDVENDDFWPPSWGEAPAGRGARLRRAHDEIAQWPSLIPLYGHRYLPAAPAGPGVPVFSVWQSDVIVYGHDLLDYVHREFGGYRQQHLSGIDPTSCPPWSLLAAGMDDEI